VEGEEEEEEALPEEEEEEEDTHHWFPYEVESDVVSCYPFL